MGAYVADASNLWINSIGFKIKITNPVKGAKIVLQLSDQSALQPPKPGSVAFAPYDIVGDADYPFSLIGSSNGIEATTGIPFNELQLSSTGITLAFAGDAYGGDGKEYFLYIYVWAQKDVDRVRIQRTAADKNIGLWGAFIGPDGYVENMANLQINSYLDHDMPA